MLATRLPALRANTAMLLEPLAFQQVQPAVRPRINEQLEIGIERELILARVHRELHTAVPRHEQLEPGARYAHVGQPLFAQRVEQVDYPLGVRHDPCRVEITFLLEGEPVGADAKSPPDRCFGLSPAKEHVAPVCYRTLSPAAPSPPDCDAGCSAAKMRRASCNSQSVVFR